jgi:hypothetical protein
VYHTQKTLKQIIIFLVAWCMYWLCYYNNFLYYVQITCNYDCFHIFFKDLWNVNKYNTIQYDVFFVSQNLQTFREAKFLVLFMTDKFSRNKIRADIK